MTTDADQFCRDIEAHLCRRNSGHLVRIVGPAFECVQRWFHLGIPFKVACLGIDRHVDRAAARTASRRRPVRIEFCDADVMDAFDEWRRAVGIRLSDGVGDGAMQDASDSDAVEDPGPVRARVSLATHLERTIARLTSARGGLDNLAWSAAIEQAARRLDALVAPAKKARGEAREPILAEMVRIDAELLDAAGHAADPGLVAQATSEAEGELEPFRPRLAPGDYASALERGRARALRNRLGLPAVVLE